MLVQKSWLKELALNKMVPNCNILRVFDVFKIELNYMCSYWGKKFINFNCWTNENICVSNFERMLLIELHLNIAHGEL